MVHIVVCTQTYRIFEIIDQNIEAKSNKLLNRGSTAAVQPTSANSSNSASILTSPSKQQLTRHDSAKLDICVSRVNFAYASRPDVPVLRNLTVAIHPLSITCFVGKSGCGKSTLLSVLSGLLFPQQGSVTLSNNVSGSTNNKEDEEEEKWLLHHNVGVMQQHDKSLMSGTIRENIEYGKVELV